MIWDYLALEHDPGEIRARLLDL